MGLLLRNLQMIETTDSTNLARIRSAQTWAIIHMALFGGFWALYLGIGLHLPREYSTFEVLWWRYALHVLLTLLFIGSFRGVALVRTTHLGKQLFRGILMVVTSVSAVLAATGMSIDEVRLILWLAPIAVIALHRLVRGSAVPRPMWIACLVCWAGTFLILRPNLTGTFYNVLWAVIAAVAFGGYQMVTADLRSDSATTSVFYSGLVTLVAMSVVMPWVWKPITGHMVLICLGMGIAGWLSLLFLDKALHTLEPGRVVVFGYTHLIASAVIGLAINRRGPGLSRTAGCVLIAFGAIFAAAFLYHWIGGWSEVLFSSHRDRTA